MDYQNNSPKHTQQGKDNTFEANRMQSIDIGNEIIKEVLTAKTKSRKDFPIEVFPDYIQQIIIDTNHCLNYPKEYTAASILLAASIAIGNKFKVQVKQGWNESAVLYIAIVGRAGINKSHPLSFALKPLEKLDNTNFKIYEDQKKDYQNFKKSNESEPEPPLPIWVQHIVSDFTPEAILDVHKFNKKGIGVYADELASWINNFNRYNKGSEEQFWLTNWSNKPIKVNRKTSENISIPEPFISVGGTIQPEVLKNLSNKRTDNGFLDRILFVNPENIKKEVWNEKELHSDIAENWNTIISNIIETPSSTDEAGNIDSIILKFEPSAKKHLIEWQKELTELSNSPEGESLSGILAKLEVYAIRLSLILEVLNEAFEGTAPEKISLHSVKGSIQMIEYFKRMAISVHSLIFDSDPINALPKNKQLIYEALPEKFTTAEGINIAAGYKMKVRTFKAFLNDKGIFQKIKHGEYEKIL
jgi:hypothetical protein